jgi:hypothetical protein
VAFHEPLQAARVGHHLAGQLLVLAEFFKPPERLIGGRTGQRAVVVLVDEGEQVLAAGDRLFAFDFGEESAVAGSGVALEELDGLMPVLQRAPAVAIAGPGPAARSSSQRQKEARALNFWRIVPMNISTTPAG